MTDFKTPRTTEAAALLLTRFAENEGAITDVEARRNAAIAAVNTEADAASEQLLADRAAMVEKLAPWWAKNSALLTKGKRKSIELGGCIVGSTKGRDSLEIIAGDEDTIVKILEKRSWATDLLRTKVSIDKAAVMKVLDGPHKKQLTQIGLRRKEGEETFYIKRAEQAGTMAEVQS